MFLHFALLSLLAVGGAITTTPDMQRWLVGRARLDERRAVHRQRGAGPGRAGAQPAVRGRDGLERGRLMAGVLATLSGSLLPSTTLALGGHALGRAHQQRLGVRAFKAGMAPLTIGLLLATGWVLTEPLRAYPATALLVAVAVGFMLFTKLSPLWLIAIGAVGGCGWGGWDEVAGLRLLLVPLLAYGVLLAALWWGQERLLFMPEPLSADHRFNVGRRARGLGRRARCAAARAAPEAAGARGVVFYLHGNAGNLESWFVNADFWRQAGFDLFMIGLPRLRQEQRPHQQPGAAGSRRARGLRAGGAGVCGQTAGAVRPIAGHGPDDGARGRAAPDLTVLVSPYTSLRALATQHYRWVPAALLRYPLASDPFIGRAPRPGAAGPWRARYADPAVAQPAAGGTGGQGPRCCWCPRPGTTTSTRSRPTCKACVRRWTPYESLVPKILSPASPSPGMM
jgi:chromate transporter